MIVTLVQRRILELVDAPRSDPRRMATILTAFKSVIGGDGIVPIAAAS